VVSADGVGSGSRSNNERCPAASSWTRRAVARDGDRELERDAESVSADFRRRSGGFIVLSSSGSRQAVKRAQSMFSERLTGLTRLHGVCGAGSV
jgi:hypothetical protein